MEILIDFENIIQRLQDGENPENIVNEYRDAHRKMIADGKDPKYTMMQGLELDVTENGPFTDPMIINVKHGIWITKVFSDI